MIWHLHTNYSRPYLCCEFWCVYHELLGKLKSGTVLTSVSSTSLLYDWGFGNIFVKTNHSFTSSYDLSCRSLCIYPHQSIACFHPTSKDGLCGAHGRKNGSMHLCHIYCKIKQQIHGDNKSSKLIKIVHIWKVNDGMKYFFYESLSPLFG